MLNIWYGPCDCCVRAEIALVLEIGYFARFLHLTKLEYLSEALTSELTLLCAFKAIKAAVQGLKV
jgi:hypothetical protein